MNELIIQPRKVPRLLTSFILFFPSFFLNFDIDFIYRSIAGRVAGWGSTKSGKAIDAHLNVIELPAVTREKCLNESDIHSRSQITSDKFCAGYLNSSIGVCEGNFKFDCHI